MIGVDFAFDQGDELFVAGRAAKQRANPNIRSGLSTRHRFPSEDADAGWIMVRPQPRIPIPTVS